jgi:hypothetical protein
MCAFPEPGGFYQTFPINDMLIVKELDVSTWNADSLALMLW